LHDPRGTLEKIIAGARAAGDPHALLRQAEFSLDQLAGRAVLAVGKAAAGMHRGLLERGGDIGDAMMVAPHGAPAPPWAWRADHPIPTQRNIVAAKAAAQFAIHHRKGTGFVVLLSGGASALLTLPAAGLTLEDVRAVTQALLASSADIRQINCIRRHIEQLKGGRLAQLMAPAPVLALVLSDVISDELPAIGSGPLWPDPTTFAEARQLVERFAPACTRILEFLHDGERGMHAETPKPGDAIFDRVQTRIIGNNALALQGARRAAEQLGYRIVHQEEGVTGQAADAGKRLAQLALAAQQRGEQGACILLGGETTVSLGQSHGRGGRNQELALAAAIELDRAAAGEAIAIASLATDGLDGPTDAAGAIVDGFTCRAARERGMDPTEYLRNHDSHTLFVPLGALIRTGPTGTNINDVAIALIL
jgi:glycerate 2-kinase